MPEAVRQHFDDPKEFNEYTQPFLFIEVSMIKAGHHKEFSLVEFKDEDCWLVSANEADKDKLASYLEKPTLDPHFDLDIEGF